MSMVACSQVAKASAQDVFAVLEDSPGVLKKPTAADFVAPAGRASITQSREYTDSPELSRFLDTLTQYPNAMPPGDFSVPMVMRIVPSAGKPQGDSMLVSAFGSVDTSTSNKRKYKLTGCRPTFSLWILHDHTVQFMSGCKPEQLEIPISKNGPVMVTVTGKGLVSGIVGRAAIATSPVDETIELEEGGALAYNVGGYVEMEGEESITGYKIVAVDTAADTITLDSAPIGWTSGKMVVPWLPAATPIGKELINAKSRVTIDGDAGKIMESTLTISLPAAYYDYVGDAYPSDSADDKRSGTIGLNTLFKPYDARRFGEALGGKEVSVEMSVNNDNGSMKITMPRVQAGSPTLGEDGPAVTVQTEGKLLGVAGNDFVSIEISGV